MKVTLSLTHRCNMSCRYCYSGHAQKTDMTLETAKQIINFAFEKSPSGQILEFSFFGGEPLLCFEMMPNLTEYIYKQARLNERRVQISITTNGTIMSKRILDFLQTYHISLCISLDGSEKIHNLNRIDKKGNDTYSLVKTNLQKVLKILPNVQVNAVYGPETLPALPETVLHLTLLGAPVIHLNPNILANWDTISSTDFKPIFEQIASYYISCYSRGKQIAINFIDSKIILFLKGEYTLNDRCGMGETEWGFAPSGNIYPCERFIGEDEPSSLCLGNIHTAIDSRKRCRIIHQRGNRNVECSRCNLEKYCMNWCGCTNYFTTGKTYLASPVLCAIERASINAAEQVMLTLTQLENDLFVEHFMQYLHSDSVNFNTKQFKKMEKNYGL